MSVWSVWGDEVWYSGWRAKNYLSCITALVGPPDLEVKRLFNVQFFKRWSIDSCWSWRPPPPQTHLYISIPYSDSFGILLPYHNSGCGWPWQLLLIPKPRFSSTLKGLCVPLSPSPPSPFGFPIMLNPHMPPNPLFAPPLAPAWVINYLMESIWCKIGPEWPYPPPGSSAVMRRKRRAQKRV